MKPGISGNVFLESRGFPDIRGLLCNICIFNNFLVLSISHSNDARIFIAEEGNNMRFMNSGVARKYIIFLKFCLVQITLIHNLRFMALGRIR